MDLGSGTPAPLSLVSERPGLLLRRRLHGTPCSAKPASTTGGLRNAKVIQHILFDFDIFQTEPIFRAVAISQEQEQHRGTFEACQQTASGFGALRVEGTAQAFRQLSSQPCMIAQLQGSAMLSDKAGIDTHNESKKSVRNTNCCCSKRLPDSTKRNPKF